MTSARALTVAMFAVAALAVAEMTLATRWGIGTSKDSVRYVKTARQMLGRETQTWTAESLAEASHFPPLYPAMLAAAAWPFRADPLVAARWVSVALLAGNAVLAGIIIWRTIGTDVTDASDRGGSRATIWPSLAVALLIAVSPSMILVHATALSEPVFIFLTLAVIASLAEYLGAPRWSSLIAAALLAGLASLARFAGLCWVVVGPASLLILTPLPVRRRAAAVCVFALLSIAPAAIWGIRNRLVRGSATHRAFAFHAISLEHFREAFRTLGAWLLPDVTTAFAIPISAAVVLATTILAIALMMRARRTARSAQTIKLITMLGLFVAGFVAMLVTSISLFDFYTPTDVRVLSPVWVGWVMIVGCATALRICGEEEPSLLRSLAKYLGVAVVVVVGFCAVGSARMIAPLWRDGGGYTHWIWRSSPTVAAVRALPSDWIVYTNASDVVYLHAPRAVIYPLPARFDPSSLIPNSKFDAETNAMGEDLRGGRAAIVWFDRLGARRRYYPSADELKRRLGLRARVRAADGIVFDYGSSNQ